MLEFLTGAKVIYETLNEYFYVSVFMTEREKREARE